MTEVEQKFTMDMLHEPIAIVGMNCQFPGADEDIEDVDAFYKMLLNGQTSIKDVPENRWNIDAYYDADRKKTNKIISRKGGFLTNPHLFDATFFKISSTEARQMDPQHRLFLEVAIRALNHANITMNSLNDSNTGVYCGISTHDYSQLNYKDQIEFNAYTSIGASNSAAAGRLSHLLNLKGPSLAVDTACSSSLSALYLAAMGIQTGQCRIAIVGGVHLSLCPDNFISPSKAHMLSATDQCSSFDKKADGYARSEGCAVIIVKRLSDAIKECDTIHGVINSIVMNQDGDDGTLLVAPNIKAQIAMHQAALARAHLSACDIEYIEAHGTGTPLGDAVEFNAIQHIHLGQHTSDKPLIIGALKSNLGHTISSSGLASLIKIVCALKHGMIPPNIHYEAPNESIDPESIPAIFPVQSIPFAQHQDKKRYAQIVNFGFSGTNVSAIIEEPPNAGFNLPKPAINGPYCFVVSAKSEYSLKQMLANYVPFLQETPANLCDICYTLMHCRDHYKFRCALIVNNKHELIEQIMSGNYPINKVLVKKDTKIISNAQQAYDVYLSGANPELDLNDTPYNKVDLPLYYFDRKTYWHEPGKSINQTQGTLIPPPVHDQSSTQVLNEEPIAIIGMSCRLPKAANIDEFLSLLAQGESGMVDIPLERWDNEKYYDADLDAVGRLCIKQLGLIDNIKNFDADFFNISPREAKLMSPQLRVFMETSYHALENANLSLDSIKDSNTGVFVGCGTNEYPRVLDAYDDNLNERNIYFATGNVSSSLAGRVAYAFDFHGPIQAIDTACSSSMTAIYNACMSLQSGDCDMAITGGVNILLSPDSNVTLSKARMLSPESRCKTFDEKADGYARSEGCGVIILKRLSTAIRDKDTIQAIIKSAVVNSDGKGGGFTIPNGSAQEKLIRHALAKAKLSPAEIDYVETHGTGTPLGDPVEVNTLTRIFSEHHSEDKPLYIGSVKTNIGHCESASGVAGIIKAVLSLQTQKFFKHLNFQTLNPNIELKNTVIPLSTLDWHKRPGDLRHAGVSSFGFSGANAHVILQQAPSRNKAKHVLPTQALLVLSAKSKVALELLLASYQTYLASTSDEFANICYTAATCRAHFLFRVAIKATSAEQAAAMLEKKAYTIYQTKKEKYDVIQYQPPFTLEQLQTAYQAGFSIHWSDFYQSLAYPFEKVKLPLYEFARETHWFSASARLKEVPIPKDWGFQLQWQHQACDTKNRNTANNPWLLIGAEQLASQLTNQGLPIVEEADNYPLDKLEGIIFALGLMHPPQTDLHASIEFQKETIKKLLNLVKMLHLHAIELQLIILTSNAIAELGTDKFNTSNSALMGFCKTLALELPQFKLILIDLDQPDNERNSAHIINEIHSSHDQHYEHVIAYRDNRRLVARLEPIPLDEIKYTLNNQARYLITGGCGGLGLVTAQALLSAGAKEVILTSRNPHKLEVTTALKEIQAYYPDRIIRTVSMDITDKNNLRDLLSDISADGLLKGIIHAAGAVIKAPLLDHQDGDVDHLFAAKVQGGWYLHELSQHLALDFFIVYSSIASIFGSNKESVYSAANSFLDALIAERQRLGLVGTAIQWGPWGEVGMAKKRSRDSSLKQALISNEQGHALVKILLHSQLNHVAIISPAYLKFMLDFIPKPLPGFYHHLANDLVTIKPPENNNSSPWLTSYHELAGDMRLKACMQMLCALCKDILGLHESEELDTEEGFFEVGFDSLMITELAANLKKTLTPALSVTVNIGFDYPSISKLAKYIQSELDNYLSNKSLPVSLPHPANDDIAVIGMSCSLPNAPDIAAFELLLEEGQSGIQDIPIERWDNQKYYDANPDTPSKSYVNKLGLIDQIKCFDADFFNISPREAKLIEPQQRIFLECSYKALENANYPPASLRGSLTGVFTGIGPNEYYSQLKKSGISNEELSAYSITGNVLNLIPGRVAYTFDFKGPSISIDTACSSSLVAIHYACQSLKNREVDYALAGGVNILLNPDSNITLCKARALSPDGQCKTFDKTADGYVRAEGCGVLFLKRLTDALQDKDPVLAVIKASAVNNDGKSAGLTVPNGKSQEEVMLKALSQTNLTCQDISYVEAHGTGTPLGDPIEVHAINNVYGNQRSDENPLYIGTVKTNIGHLESASGVAGVIKTIISLQKKKIFKHLNFKQLNPNITINNTRIAMQPVDWNPNSRYQCAGVNAFGFSGTNAHIILQAYPDPQSLRLTHPIKTHVLVLSAKSKTALQALAARYQQYLETTSYYFGDICFTAATCREHYAYRLAIAAESCAKACQLLATNQAAYSHEENGALDLPKNSTLNALLSDYLQGLSIDWALYYKTCGEELIKVSLPNYPFDRREFWFDKKPENITDVEGVHPLLGQMLSMPGNEYLFSQKLDLARLAYIKQHHVFEKMVFPAAAYVESGLMAAKLILKCSAFRIEKFNIERPLCPKQGQDFQLQVKPIADEHYKLNVFAKQADHWQPFAEMELLANALSSPTSIDIDTLKSSFGERLDLSEVYENFRNRSLLYGEDFHVLQEGYVKSNSVLAKISLTKKNHESGYYYHPVLLDGAMQSILLLSNNNAENTTYIPYTLARMTVFQAAPRTIWVRLTKYEASNTNELCVDISLYDSSGLLIAEMDELKLRKVTRGHFLSYESGLHQLYHIKWSALNSYPRAAAELPEFLVIAKDKTKAKKILSTLNYQLITDSKQLIDSANKNIIFLYEQEQFADLFQCCQLLFKLRPKCFILVTENAYAIEDNHPVNPYHTMASSFWRSFSNELGLEQNFTIDLSRNSSMTTTLNYIFTTNSAEKQFAVRDIIYTPRLKKKQLPIPEDVQAPLFMSNASYLIVGGTGGLAKPMIEYLINRQVKQIILTSRSACPTDIDILIESAKQKQVCIQHYAADASDYQQMNNIVAAIEHSPYPLKGVFYLAGVVRDGLIINLNNEDNQSVLNAKMDGALILHQLTKKTPLDWFVLFSSSASLLGARGQANYAAANGFLDGLAHLRQQQDLPAIAINWGPFHRLGMTTKLAQTIQQPGFIPLDTDSLDILDVLLKNQFTQISPCPIHWDTYCKHNPKQTLLSDLVKASAPPGQHFLNALRQCTQEERIIKLTHALRDITANVLALDDIEQIKASDNLFSMGIDSLMSMDIRNRIHDKLQCQTLSLPIEYFINTPTINSIARYIADELQSFFDNPEKLNPPEDSMEKIIPLCDFQYLFWVINKLDSSFNLGMQIQLRGKLNKEYVSQAFDFVIKKNSAFWINFDKDTPTQRLQRQGQFQLVYQDISLNPDPEVLNNEFYNNIFQIIPLTEQPLIKVYLYQVNHNLHELHIVIPHIIVDDKSCEIVFDQFKKNYQALTLGKSLIEIPEKESYFNYIQYNNHHHEKNLPDKVDFWRTYNKDIKMLHFGNAHHLPDAAHQSKHLFHFPLATQAIKKFMEWHQENNINISTGLVAACQIAFYKINYQDKAPVILIHSGREGSQYQLSVGLFSEYKRINICINESHKLIDCIHSIEEQLLKTAPYQKCSHFIKDNGLIGSRLSIGQHLTFKFNKFFLTKHFKESQLHSIIIDYYLKHLSRLMAIRKNIVIKYKFNQLFKWKRPLQKPMRLRTLISITPSFFTKEPPNRQFADLDYSFSSHFRCVDRPIGNQTLWVYFSKDQHDQYQLSINGPLTADCKHEIANGFNQIISKFVDDSEQRIEALIKDS